jgi:hypothetical protein
VELGGELGMMPFSWFYVGQGIHQAWLHDGNDQPEWEVRTLFTVPLSLFTSLRTKLPELYALNEYTYDLRRGSGIRNEMGVGLRIPLPMPRFSVLFGWRHVDWVHSSDMDQFEGALQVEI